MAKGRGRYQHDDRRKTQREYMSYEDVPLEEYRYNEPEPSNITGKFIKIFLILFLAVASCAGELPLPGADVVYGQGADVYGRRRGGEGAAGEEEREEREGEVREEG